MTPETPRCTLFEMSQLQQARGLFRTWLLTTLTQGSSASLPHVYMRAPREVILHCPLVAVTARLLQFKRHGGDLMVHIAF